MESRQRLDSLRSLYYPWTPSYVPRGIEFYIIAPLEVDIKSHQGYGEVSITAYSVPMDASIGMLKVLAEIDPIGYA